MIIKNWYDFNEKLKISDTLNTILDYLSDKNPHNRIVKLLSILSVKDFENIPYNPDNLGISDIGKFSINSGSESVKIGRFIKGIITKIQRGKIVIPPLYDWKFSEITDSEIEDFIKLYNAESLNYKSDLEIKIYSGEDIYRVYNSKIEKEGTELYKSCMNGASKEKLSIYINNPDKAELATIWYGNREFEDGHLMGRAILWHLDSGYKFLDRIYSISPKWESYFINWANKNGYLTKLKQDRMDYEVYLLNGKKIEFKEPLSCSMDLGDIEQFPYLDTLKYLSKDSKKITDRILDDTKWKLDRTDGGKKNIKIESDLSKFGDIALINDIPYLKLNNLYDYMKLVDIDSSTLDINGKTFNFSQIIHTKEIFNKLDLSISYDNFIKKLEFKILDILGNPVKLWLNSLNSHAQYDPKTDSILLSIRIEDLGDILDRYSMKGYKTFLDYISNIYNNEKDGPDILELPEVNIKISI
jgi:hypothetical protein